MRIGECVGWKDCVKCEKFWIKVQLSLADRLREEVGVVQEKQK